MTSTIQTKYPFSAIVGQNDMKLALCLIAVQPAIGGVLIYGERGTAKTTAVRALPSLLGGNTRVIELPLNASEDRVVGTLRLDTLMQNGQREFTPGLMAEADGNILYVDEINLLEDSIVDLLLDAAATGVCHIEREGVSMNIPARFVLIGTMNPEEGALRPQLLDRFGLSVKVSGNLSRDERITLIQRLTDMERDPSAFSLKWSKQEELLSQRIRHAAEIYKDVVFSDELVAERISNLKGGGSTPLIPALEATAKLIDRMRDEDLSIYILSDGRYDRYTTGHENLQISEFGNFCQTRKIPVTLINAGRTNKTSIKRTTLLAAKLHASYHQLEGLRIADKK